MEDDLMKNGRRTQKKMKDDLKKKMEEDLKKIEKMEDDLKKPIRLSFGIQPINQNQPNWL